MTCTKADRKTQELEAIIKNTFEAVVLLESYPKSQIDISIDILESDGWVLSIRFV